VLRTFTECSIRGSEPAIGSAFCCLRLTTEIWNNQEIASLSPTVVRSHKGREPRWVSADFPPLPVVCAVPMPREAQLSPPGLQTSLICGSTTLSPTRATVWSMKRDWPLAVDASQMCGLRPQVSLSVQGGGQPADGNEIALEHPPIMRCVEAVSSLVCAAGCGKLSSRADYVIAVGRRGMPSGLAVCPTSGVGCFPLLLFCGMSMPSIPLRGHLNRRAGYLPSSNP
jgi:hypothetical protein